ncbi:DUF1775 domain-containing protein [Microbacterium sp. B2969]|uniref:DUF1775 domain-containing protein n=1 Tax=Microbacterium alkaliflavum TaxID=3248839 RepID=A0ABW7Q877_9MICO
MTISRTPRHAARTPRRRTALAFVGVAAGAALALAAPLAASAHVHVDPATAPAGASQTLTFSFSHGCDGSPTTALVIDIPDGVATTTPVVQGGWTIQRELGADEQPTRVTFTSDAPVESGLQASVALVVAFSKDAANSTAAFPVTQECVDGSTAWTQIAAAGEDPESLDAPAPTVAVGDAVATDDDGHAATTDHAAADGASSHESTEAAGDPVARLIAGGALAVAVGALVVVLVRGRRRA